MFKHRDDCLSLIATVMESTHHYCAVICYVSIEEKEKCKGITWAGSNRHLNNYARGFIGILGIQSLTNDNLIEICNKWGLRIFVDRTFVVCRLSRLRAGSE